MYSDTNLFHEKAVKRGAALAKEELGVDVELKIDPTEGIDQHYAEIKKRNPENQYQQIVIPVFNHDHHNRHHYHHHHRRNNH